MKYQELITVINSDEYSLEMEITIDVTFHEDCFTYELDSIDEIYHDGELAEFEEEARQDKETIESIATYIQGYKFNEDAIWKQAEKGEEV